MCFIDIRNGCLNADALLLQSFAEILDDQEREAAQLFRQPQARDRYIQVRAMLRITLAEYLSVKPTELQFTRTAYGKPYLKSHDLFFNLSHSADRLVIAVADHDCIGIDIEAVQPRHSLAELARRCFSETEFSVWRQFPAAIQQQSFYQLWTKKEAFVKAVGRGIALGLPQCELEMPEGRRFISVPPAYGPASTWQVIEFSPAAGFCGAVVTSAEEFTVRHQALNAGNSTCSV